MGLLVKLMVHTSLSIDLNLRRSFKWSFVIVHVTQLIIGIDFPSYYNLLIDVTKLSSKGKAMSISSFSESLSFINVSISVS